MGNSKSKLPENRIELWTQLTFLNRSAILRCYDRFRSMNEKEIDANPLGERVESKIIAGYFPELKANPFGLRICKVFASDETGETMNFEDFLDMVSVFSENAPLQMKADWAFRIFDFDQDGKITASDIERVVRQLCGNEQFSRQELDKIIYHVLQEAESRDRNSIGPQEFRNIMSRSPDFGVHFTLSF